MATPSWDETQEITPSFDETEAIETPSLGESAIRGATQGATLGFADEIAGGVEALWEKAKGDPTEFGKLYQQFRDESRQNFEEARKANPKTYGASEIGAGVATAFVPGLNIAKGAKLASMAGKAAGIGAAAGTGYSEGETAGEVLKDAAIGAALGAGTTVAAPHVGRLAGRAGEKLKGSAERFAARAMGAERGTIKKLGQDKVQEAGRFALDEGIISPLANTDDMIARNQAAQARGAQKMEDVYSAVDDAGQSTFNPLDVASKVDEELGDFYRSPINRGETRQLENTLESIVMRGDKNIPLKDAQKLKQELGKVANWKNNVNVSDKERMARSAYGIVSQAIDEATEKGAKSIGKGSLQETLNEGKRLYGMSKATEDLLENKQAREQGNKLVGLTDWALLGSGGAVAPLTGGASIPATLALYGTKKGLEKYGSQNAALLLDKTSRALSNAPKVTDAAMRNPIATQTAIPESIRKTAKSALPKAAESDGKRKRTRPLKGREKWANDGFEKLKKNRSDFSLNKDALLKSKKGQRLLIAASDLKPGSKAFNKIAAQIEEEFGGKQ